MRALTLTQPWSGLVASGIKPIENRPRGMVKHEDFGKPFALHASRVIDDAIYSRIRQIAPEIEISIDSCTTSRWYDLSRITSAVIGVATIADCVRWWTIPATGARELRSDVTRNVVDLGDAMRWFFGPVGYVLRDVTALREPVPCRGFQGFWTLPPDVETKVRAQLGPVHA